MTERPLTIDPRPGRRVCRFHDSILDGLTDLVVRANGATVLDVGCNRGLAGYAMACNGARLVHGIDLAPDAVYVARALFADLAECRSQFEIGDLTRGADCLVPFGTAGWDIILMLGTYHKLARPPSKPYVDLGARGMNAEELSLFMTHLGHKTLRYFAWRGDAPQAAQVDQDMTKAGLRLIHKSEISGPGGYSCIWERPL